MKICHVTNVHGPFDGRIFYKMACTAVEYGHDVTLVAPHDKKENRNGVNIIPISKSSNRIKRFLDTFKLYRILLEINADIYHFHDPELIPVMKKIRKRSGKRVIYDIHEYYREVILQKSGIPKLLRRLVSNITWKQEISACRTFDCTIAATKELSLIFEPYSKNNNYILNYDFSKDIILDRDTSTRSIDIIHVGSLSIPRLDFLLDVAQELFNRQKLYTWYFIGVPNNLFIHIDQKISFKYKHLIKFIGKIPFEDVKSYYKRAMIGINYHPMEKRFLVAIPMKIFEYMKYSLTVITSDLPPLREYITVGVNGYISKSNTISEFADLIEYAYDTNNFDQIGFKNQLDIRNKYNWETEAKKLMRIYDNLMEA